MSSEESRTERTVPVEPPVHVESFPTHCTLTWKAEPLAQFLAAVEGLSEITPTTAVRLNDTSTAGRRVVSLSSVEPAETVRYLRVEPDAAWTLSWDRRTWPVVSLSGTVSVDRCRRMHLATTDCEEWADEAVETLRRALDRQ